MAKKRSCRRTKLEKQQHETAVKIRKMTDEQICEVLFENTKNNDSRVGEFLDFVEVGIGNGIGSRTIEKLRRIAEENGFAEGGKI